MVREEQKLEIKLPDKPDNQLDLMVHLTEVQSKVRKEITSDFTLARLEEQDKEGIIEMTSNAYFAKSIILTLRDNARIWQKNVGYYGKEITQEQEKKLTRMAERIFRLYMIKIDMTTILNRNRDDNFLLKLVAGETPKEGGQDQLNTFMDKMKEVTKSEEQSKEEKR